MQTKEEFVYDLHTSQNVHVLEDETEDISESFDMKRKCFKRDQKSE